jgi:hypothetical protein
MKQSALDKQLVYERWTLQVPRSTKASQRVGYSITLSVKQVQFVKKNRSIPAKFRQRMKKIKFMKMRYNIVLIVSLTLNFKFFIF